METRLPFDAKYWLRRNKHNQAAWDRLTNDEFWQIQDFLSELRVILDVVITTDERLEKALPAEFHDLTCGEFYAKEEVQRLLTAQELRTVRKFPDYIEFLTDEEVEDILKNVELEINEKARQSK